MRIKRIYKSLLIIRKPYPVISADGTMIERVIANLLDNAVKYSPQDSEDIGETE